MKKLIFLIGIFISAFAYSQSFVLRPLIQADILNGYDDIIFVWEEYGYFTSIQDAHDSPDTEAGTAICVMPGTYTETLNFTKDSILLFAFGGPDVTIIQLEQSSDIGFLINADSVVVGGVDGMGFTFQGDSCRLIVIASGKSGTEISYNVIKTEGDPSVGVYVDSSGSDLKLIKNQFITDSGDSAFYAARNLTDAEILGNEFMGADSTDGYAILMTGFYNGRIEDNYIHGLTVPDASGYLTGIYLHTYTTSSHTSDSLVILNNRIRDCSKGLEIGNTSQTSDLKTLFINKNLFENCVDGIYIVNDAQVYPADYDINDNIFFDNVQDIDNRHTTAANYGMNMFDGLVAINDINPVVELDIDGKIDVDYTEAAAAANETRYFDFTLTNTTDPVAYGEVNSGYFAYNKTAGSNGVYTINALEGVARSSYADEAGTFRGVYGRIYINADATSTMRTGIGGEFSARAGYSGGTECIAENGTAFVGARIWMAPYYTSGSLSNINNFHGLWLHNEHASNAVTNGIFMDNAAGTGGWNYGLNLGSARINTADILFHNGATIDNTETDTLIFTETVVKVDGILAVTSDLFIDGDVTIDDLIVDSIDANYINVDTIILNEFMNPNASQGANLGASGTEFNLVYADSIHANWFGGSDFEIGESGSDVTFGVDTIKGAPIWAGELSVDSLVTPYDNTLIVAKSGGDHLTIQQAIDYAATQTPSASSRWTILIYPGVYDEAITMYEYVDLRGVGTKTDVVIYQNAANVITFADSVEVSNLTVRTGATGDIYCFQDDGNICYAKVMDVHMESTYTGGGGWYGFMATAAGNYTFERCSYRITTSTGDAAGFLALAAAATIRVIDGDFYMAGATGPPTSSKSHFGSVATSNCVFYTKGNRLDGDANCNVFYAEDGTYTSSNDVMLTTLADQVAAPATVYIKNGFREYTVDDDDILNFSNIEDITSETFAWDEGDDRFELSDDFYVDGALVATGTISGKTSLTLDTDATIVLAAADCHNAARFNNDADVIDYTLPGAEAGLVIIFYDIAGGVITIDPVDGTDTIYLNGTSVGAGDAIDSPGAVGDFICLMAIDATRWVTIGRSGVWVDGGAD